MKIKQSMSMGDPPILWSAVRRLPDGAVTADDGRGKDSVSFILRPKDLTHYVRVTFVFRGANPERNASHDVEDAQLRRWKASAWWPKEWR